MKWLYHYERAWMGKGNDPIVAMLLRPTIFDPEGHKMIGKVVHLRLIAADGILDHKNLKGPASDPNFLKIYYEELRNKDYYIKHEEVSKDNEIYLASAFIYVKQSGFTPNEIFEWVRTYFTIKGYQHSEFEQGLGEDFLDLNPLLNAIMKAEGILVDPNDTEKIKEMEGKLKKAKRKKKKRRPRKL